MADDKSKQGPQDRNRVSSNERWEVSYMAEKFNVSAAEVERAVQAVGNSREKVEAYLKKNHSRR